MRINQLQHCRLRHLTAEVKAMIRPQKASRPRPVEAVDHQRQDLLAIVPISPTGQ